MRQFKFRAWHKELKVMRNFDLDSLYENKGVLWFFTDDYTIDHNPEKYRHGSPISNRIDIMQYLGEDCKDSEGKEICEGDIILFEFSNSKYIIEYSNGTFWAIRIDGHCFPMSDMPPGRRAIIGNIHQNPGLRLGL